MEVFASSLCESGSPRWSIGTDHFDGEQYTIDAILEPIVTPDRDYQSYYSEGNFGIIIPRGYWAMVTAEQDGSGDFRLLKGQNGVCQTVDFAVEVFMYGDPALVLI